MKPERQKHDWITVAGFFSASFCCLIVGIGIGINAKKVDINENARPVHPGDVVVNRLGRKGVVTMATPFEYGVWNVRVEGGGLEYWTNAEIDHRE